jgi:hypothetical protein
MLARRRHGRDRDTSRFNWASGTYASRAIVTSGNAVGIAARKLRDKALTCRGLLEASPADLELVDGAVRIKGMPSRSLTLGALAGVANPIRYAYGKSEADAALQLVKPRQGAVLAEGAEPGLEANGYYAPPQATFASGVHAAIVEVDRATGQLTFVKYVVQHDCGVIVNPIIVEGQIHGGVAQGIGGALYERIVYDRDGQLLSGSFMDFLMPTAAELPMIEIGHIETPSPLNPLGIKGVARAGTIPVGALVAEAVDDAGSIWGARPTCRVADRILELIERSSAQSFVLPRVSLRATGLITQAIRSASARYASFLVILPDDLALASSIAHRRSVGCGVSSGKATRGGLHEEDRRSSDRSRLLGSGKRGSASAGEQRRMSPTGPAACSPRWSTLSEGKLLCSAQSVAASPSPSQVRRGGHQPNQLLGHVDPHASVLKGKSG